MTNAFITPLTSEVNTLTKTICVVYAFLLTLYKLLSCNWVLPPVHYLQDVLIWMAGSIFFICHRRIIGITPGICEMTYVSDRIVGQFYLHTACWNLPKCCAILPTYTLHFIYTWLLKKQGEAINLAFNKHPTFCIPCKEKANWSEFFLFSDIKNSITLSHRNIFKCSFHGKDLKIFCLCLLL